MKLGFSQSEIIATAKALGLPTAGFIQRRIARAYDLVESNKISRIDDGIFRVRSQYEADKSYIVNLNHGEPSCDCPDGERTINCKHRIASLLYAQKQASREAGLTIYDETINSYFGRGRWIVTDHYRKAKYIVYRETNGRLICPCPSGRTDCEHKKAIKAFRLQSCETCQRTDSPDSLSKMANTDYENGKDTRRIEPVEIKRIVNECGTDQAKAIQDRLNDRQKNNGTGAKAPSQQQSRLNRDDPFQQSELNDIDQIEGRSNGELAWKLSNGDYCISYRGIMKLAEKHEISFDELSINDDTVIAKAKNGNERISGKPVNGNETTALELAKRNAARQLLPLPEIKAVEHKAKLEATFDWQKAQAKCVALVGEANVSIIIHDLTQAGKLRQDNPSHYNRTEWLMIHDYCKKDAKVQAEMSCPFYTHSESFCKTDKKIDPEGKSLNRWSYNSVVFLEECHKRIDAVRAEKQVEANELPPMNGDGKRKLQMDKKLRTWLVETDGTKKEISCREICEQFETNQNPNLVPRLRAGIDSGADISTVELT